ncbi:MAG: imidazolonepropionase [Elusimicrobiota bacterium]|nr:MAG: imidazolonepropionase [Elusimicrobiota bacterium]
MATLVLNAAELLTMAGPDGPRSGPDKDRLGLVRDGAVLIDQGRVLAAGSKDVVMANPAAKGAKMLSAEGKVLMPGFVDAHTHPVFAAPRLADFEARIAGQGYAEIAQRGGGILSTVNGVRGAKEADLAAGLRARAFDFAACGTTTIEAKSGYGLDLDNELKMLRAMRTVSSRGPVEIVATFLGAHAVPPEYKGRKSEFVARVCADMIPRVGEQKLASFVDVFCEKGWFDLGDLELVAEAGAKAGLGLKVHAEQLSRSGSIAPSLARGAATVDHLDCVEEADLPALAASKTVACLVPGSNYFLGKPYPPARRLLDAGAAVALATDFNPGTCPCWDMRMILSIACTQMKMSPAEALVAATINGAHAAGLGATHGSLEPGKTADLVCFDAEDHRELAYWFGAPKTRWTMKRGELVYKAS